MSGERVGLYPGTFDPVTLGHLDIVKRAVKLVDHLIIGIADNPGKTQAFARPERVEMMRRETAPLAGDGRAKITVTTFDSLLVHYAREVGAQVIIRGLRAVSDFEYEFQMVGMNQRLDPQIETVFLMAKEEFSHVSSSGDRLAVGQGDRLFRRRCLAFHHAGRGRSAEEALCGGL